MKTDNEVIKKIDECQALIDNCYYSIARIKRDMEDPLGATISDKRKEELHDLRNELIDMNMKLSYRTAQRDTLKWVLDDIFWG